MGTMEWDPSNDRPDMRPFIRPDMRPFIRPLLIRPHNKGIIRGVVQWNTLHNCIIISKLKHVQILISIATCFLLSQWF